MSPRGTFVVPEVTGDAGSIGADIVKACWEQMAATPGYTHKDGRAFAASALGGAIGLLAALGGPELVHRMCAALADDWRAGGPAAQVYEARRGEAGAATTH